MNFANYSLSDLLLHVSLKEPNVFVTTTTKIVDLPRNYKRIGKIKNIFKIKKPLK